MDAIMDARQEKSWTAKKNSVMGINVRLFGPFSCMINDAPLPPLRSRRGYLLLASLILRGGRAIARESLMESLWPESDTKSGQENLRRTLTDLRRALGAESQRIVSDGHQSVRFSLDDTVFADVLRFDAFAARWDKIGDWEAATEAISLYRGPLLEGFDADWIPGERAAREEQCREMLEFLARRALQNGDASRAVTLARRAERLDPLNAATQRLLYESLAAAGDAPAAQRAYRAFRDLLHRETNQQPDTETVAAGLRASAPRREPRIQEQGGGNSQVYETPQSAKSEALPSFLTSFVGRKEEIAAVSARLAETGVRLLTLTGVGGIGKTRLAVEAAREWGEAAFADLSALPADAAEDMIFGVALTALGGKPEAEVAPRQSVAALLNRPLTLILDNAEHLVPAISHCAGNLLKDAPLCKILATSRRPLAVPGEILWPVAPHDEAVALFIERARAAKPDVALTDANRKMITDLCHRLDNLPLAIELAAARLRVLPLEKIAERLTHNSSLLASDTALVSERQRTLRGALNWSHALLNEDEKRLFAALSVFVGGATLEAMEAVAPPALLGTAEPLEILFRLVDHSLVIPGERFRLLETVREFAAERLAESGAAEPFQQRHFAYFLTQAQETEARIWGPDSRLYLDRLEAERENCRAAIQGAGAADAVTLCLALANFWSLRGLYREGITLLQGALKRAEASHENLNPISIAAARCCLGRFQLAVGEMAGAETAFQEAVALCRKAGDRGLLVDLLNALGAFYRDQGRIAEARTVYEEGVALCHAASDEPRTAILRREQGILSHVEGNYTAARAQFEAALTAFGASDQRWDETAGLWWAGFACEAQGDFEAATRYFEKALMQARSLRSPTMELTNLQSLADVARDRGDFGAARERYEATLPLARHVGDWYKQAVAWRGMSEASRGLHEADKNPKERAAAREYCRNAISLAADARASLVFSLELLSEAAAVCALEGRRADAVRLYAYIESSYTARNVALPAAVRARHARDGESLLLTLDAAEYAALRESGEKMTREQAFAIALAGESRS